MSAELKERNRHIVELRQNGWSFGKIGALYNVDATAARTIWERELVKKEKPKPKEMRDRKCLHCQKPIKTTQFLFLCHYCRTNYS